MSKYMIKTDSDRCISCRACELHCKVANKVPGSALQGQIVTVGPRGSVDNPKAMNLFMPCFHCEQPWCVAACPTGACVRRESDGIVYIDAELCVGCKACIISCPWRIPQWDETHGKAVKCDLCMDRIDAGLKPACVTACTTHALSFVDPNAASFAARKAHGEKILTKKLARKS